VLLLFYPTKLWVDSAEEGRTGDEEDKEALNGSPTSFSDIK